MVCHCSYFSNGNLSGLHRGFKTALLAASAAVRKKRSASIRDEFSILASRTVPSLFITTLMAIRRSFAFLAPAGRIQHRLIWRRTKSISLIERGRVALYFFVDWFPCNTVAIDSSNDDLGGSLGLSNLSLRIGRGVFFNSSIVFKTDAN